MKNHKVKLRPIKPTDTLKVALSQDRAGKIFERNPNDTTPFDFKPILKTQYEQGIYKSNWEKINNNKPWNLEETVELSKTQEVPLFTKENFKITKDLEGDVVLPLHQSNYELFRKKKFTELADKEVKIPQSKLVPLSEYSEKKMAASVIINPPPKGPEEEDKKNVYRSNLFAISKPFDDVNKDFKYKPDIVNAVTISQDTPFWFQGTSQFYSKDFNDFLKKYKASQKNLPKTDIFGQDMRHFEKIDDDFMAVPPSKSQVYDRKKMALVEKHVESTRGSHLKFKWEENVDKQSYDRGSISAKIGFTSQPHIKALETKAMYASDIFYSKIGEDKSASRLKPQKNLDLKIGHPNSEYVYGKKKARDDGYLDNRKHIDADNYYKSNFFN